MEQVRQDFRCQIFATDIDSNAIEVARTGIYPESIVVDVSPERLKRFFLKEGNFYRAKTEIREMIVFAMQNIINDPPFSKLDLISCRNLLIYLSAELQKKILPLFNYILNEKGVLFLGSSETIGGFVDLFSIFNSKWKFYTRNKPSSANHIVLEFPTAPLINEVPEGVEASNIRENRLPRLAEKMLLNSYAPPCVFINEKYDILYIHGRTGKYLEPAEGEANLNLVDMAREGLKAKLRSAIREALAQKSDIVHKDVRVKDNSGFRTINLIVKPVQSPRAMKGLMMVVFEDVTTAKPLDAEETVTEPARGLDQRILDLEQELSYSKETLQTTIEEVETSNEELKSTNEELQSTNEELQSANEELETSKEELQSLNEELTTVNTELQGKIDDLSQINNDMKNLLDSTNIAILFLDNNLRVRRFTPEATQIINLIQTDVGRPINHIVTNLIYEDLVADARNVLDTLIHREAELQTKDGHWYNMRISPYRTTDNVIDGLVVTFVNVHHQKQSEQSVHAAREYAENILDTVREPFIILDGNLRVISANRSFYRLFRVEPELTEGKLIYDLGNRQWDIPKLRELLEEVISQNTVFEDFEVEHEFPNLGKRVMLLNARRVYQESGKSQMILLAIEDVTERR
jgi:two-component system CheB/CheR fusion protein